MTDFERSTPRQKFVPEVESYRGIAEFNVEYSHITGVMLSPVIAAGLIVSGSATAWTIHIFGILFNSAAAVSMFSVISGFVLGRMLDADSTPYPVIRYGRFIWRRCWRLLPVQLVMSVVIVVCLELFVVGRPVDLSPYPMLQSSMGDFINGTNIPSLSAFEFLRNVSTWSISINPVSWYLNIEMGMCLLLPLLHAAARKKWLAIDLLILAAFSVLTSVWNPAFPAPFFFLVYLPGFYFGLTVESWGRKLAGFVARVPVAGAVLMIGAYLVMVSLLNFMPGKSAARIHFEGFFAFIFLSILVWAPPEPVSRVLNLRPLRWIGRIAFGSYLIHCLLLILLFRAVALHAPRWFGEHGVLLAFVSVPFVLAGTFALASAMFLWVEKPAIRFGDRLLAALLGSWPGAQAAHERAHGGGAALKNLPE